jgi:hypothetical protein
MAMVLYAAMPMLGAVSGAWLVLMRFDDLTLAIVGLLGGFAVGLGLWGLLVPRSGLITKDEALDIASGTPHIKFRDSSLGRWLTKRRSRRTRDGSSGPGQ